MMPGIEILSTTEVAIEYTYNYWLAGIIYLFLVISCTILGAVVYYTNHSTWLEGACIGILISGLLGLFLFAAVCIVSAEPSVYETQYKVTINESVSMVEFLDKYEIIDQEGKIYTVREKK
jgi:hypothetical protein